MIAAAAVVAGDCRADCSPTGRAARNPSPQDEDRDEVLLVGGWMHVKTGRACPENHGHERNRSSSPAASAGLPCWAPNHRCVVTQAKLGHQGSRPPRLPSRPGLDRPSSISDFNSWIWPRQIPDFDTSSINYTMRFADTLVLFHVLGLSSYLVTVRPPPDNIGWATAVPCSQGICPSDLFWIRYLPVPLLINTRLQTGVT